MRCAGTRGLCLLGLPAQACSCPAGEQWAARQVPEPSEPVRCPHCESTELGAAYYVHGEPEAALRQCNSCHLPIRERL